MLTSTSKKELDDDLNDVKDLNMVHNMMKCSTHEVVLLSTLFMCRPKV